MPTVRPFRAIRYNAEKLRDLSRVVAPPYDVIPIEEQDKLYSIHPNNVIRLILNKITPKDTGTDNRYVRAKEFFDLWLEKKILVRDEKDSFYIYSQRYMDGKRTVDQVGFVGLMELESGGRDKVLPHENTLAAPKKDRLNLTRAVMANLEPIFVLYDDSPVTKLLNKYRASHRAIIDIKREGVKHSVWKVDDLKTVRAIEAGMKNKNIFIADGHHRYEVAKMYSREVLRSSLPKKLKDSAKYIMVYFVESDEKMLTVLPAHRLIKEMNGLKKNDIIKKLTGFFHIEKAAGLKPMMARLASLRAGHAFGMYLGRNDFYTLRLNDVSESDSVIRDKPEAWKHLDVSILHIFIFQHVLRLRDDDDNIDFLKDPVRCVKAVDSGEFGSAFFLNPTKVSEVKKIARMGERMPRKSTYFYPKQLSGLVINKFQ